MLAARGYAAPAPFLNEKQQQKLEQAAQPHGAAPPPLWVARLRQYRRVEPHPLLDEYIQNSPILRRVPRRLLPYVQRFANAPYSHVVSFFILHEVSAIVPLMGLWYVFNALDFAPLDWAPLWAVEHGQDMLKPYIDVEKGIFRHWQNADPAKLLVQGAAAYAITKMLMPLRIMACAALTPPVSRWFIEPWGKIIALFRKGGRKRIGDTRI